MKLKHLKINTVCEKLQIDILKYYKKIHSIYSLRELILANILRDFPLPTWW